MGCRRAHQSEPPRARRRCGPDQLSGPRDRQRSRVYAWERRFVAPRDPTTIAYPQAQAIIDAIWFDMDLRYPPAVAKLPRHATATIASANRLSIFLPDQTPAWCLLHEIAHAMTTKVDGSTDGHGPHFMGIYLQLLVRYLRLGEIKLQRSLQDAGIHFRRDARAVFLNPAPTQSLLNDSDRR